MPVGRQADQRGDLVVDTGEQCDNGPLNSNTRADACRTTCVAATCGDGTVDTGEDCDDGHAATAPVGKFAARKPGLFDVDGNVREWMLDTYNGRLPGGEQKDWRQNAPSKSRVVKGGSWEDLASSSRAASRDGGQNASTSSNATGFRLVLGPKISW